MNQDPKFFGKRSTTKVEQAGRILFGIVIAVIAVILNLKYGYMDWTIYLGTLLMLGIVLPIAILFRIVAFPSIDIKKLIEDAYHGDTGQKIMAGLIFLGICLIMSAVILFCKPR